MIRSNPAGLGVIPIPLLVIGAGAAAAWLTSKFGGGPDKALADAIAYTGVARPTAPPPPAAPQTREEMLHWTPEQERAAYETSWGNWLQTAIPAMPSSGVPAQYEEHRLVYAALVVGAVSLLVVLK